MSRREFNTCLNKESKIYNVSYGSLIGAALLMVPVGLIMGMIWGFGGGVLGFGIGRILSKEWQQGNLQRKLYWHLPYGKYWIDKNVPESHHRELM